MCRFKDFLGYKTLRKDFFFNFKFIVPDDEQKYGSKLSKFLLSQTFVAVVWTRLVALLPHSLWGETFFEETKHDCVKDSMIKKHLLHRLTSCY